MAASLTIRDGSSPYWWMSPDIWLVPGTDPNGVIGAPVAGQPAYLWARVGNSGSSDATGARVDFFWANPALQVLRSTATQIGYAYADVPAGGSQDALCLVPWVPTIVNGGHECLIATVTHPDDPLPTPLPDDFDPPGVHQVAQRNLTVLTAPMPMTLALTLGAPRRFDKAVQVRVRTGGELSREALRRVNLGKFVRTPHDAVVAGLRREGGCRQDDDVGPGELEVRIPRGTLAGVHVSLHDRGLRPGEYQLVHIVEEHAGRVLGGYSFVVIGAVTGGVS